MVRCHKLLGLVAALGLAVALGACGATNFIQTAIGSKVPAQTVSVAVNSWIAARSIAFGYLGYCRIGTLQAGDARVCSKTVINIVVKAEHNGEKEVMAVEALLTKDPAGIPVVSYNTFTSQINVLTGIISQYNLTTPGVPVPAPIAAAAS